MFKQRVWLCASSLKPSCYLNKYIGRLHIVSFYGYRIVKKCAKTGSGQFSPCVQFKKNKNKLCSFFSPSRHIVCYNNLLYSHVKQWLLTVVYVTHPQTHRHSHTHTHTQRPCIVVGMKAFTFTFDNIPLTEEIPER